MPAYLDHAAGTTLRPAAAAALAEALGTVGNPSSVHRHGQAARALLEEARERLAAAAGCEPVEVLLTSGGTEAVNLAITGGWRARGGGALLRARRRARGDGGGGGGAAGRGRPCRAPPDRRGGAAAPGRARARRSRRNRTPRC